MPKIIQDEIFLTIKDFWIKKASRPDQIPNKILKVIARKICNFLKEIFNDSFVLGYYFLYFKESIIIILFKIGDNQNYTS